MGERLSPTSPALALFVSQESQALRRRLGPLAWLALETLALAAETRSGGWVAPCGVRGLAEDLGISKDTAARAVAKLLTAGLVTRERLASSDPARRSGYRLHLPVGMALTCAGEVAPCPNDQDTNCRPADEDGLLRPSISDSVSLPARPTSSPKPPVASRRAATEAPAPVKNTAAKGRRPKPGHRRKKAHDGQGRLFEIESGREGRSFEPRFQTGASPWFT
jgi:DNA-binding MarR family transcriptional regulator